VLGPQIKASLPVEMASFKYSSQLSVLHSELRLAKGTLFELR